MTRRAQKETKRKQLAQLAGRQNIKLELKMGNYANWFITWQLPVWRGKTTRSRGRSGGQTNGTNTEKQIINEKLYEF